MCLCLLIQIHFIRNQTTSTFFDGFFSVVFYSARFHQLYFRTVLLSSFAFGLLSLHAIERWHAINALENSDERRKCKLKTRWLLVWFMALDLNSTLEFNILTGYFTWLTCASYSRKKTSNFDQCFFSHTIEPPIRYLCVCDKTTSVKATGLHFQ